MYTRAKGLKNERRAVLLLMRLGYRVFRLYQPPYAKQGELDLIAVGHGRIRFVQVRTNSYHDLRPLKIFHALYCDSSLIPTAEVFLYKDRVKDPVQRVME